MGKIKNIEYSIIVPVFNSETTLEILTNRLLSVCQTFTDSFEIIYIDDCSSDNSWNILKSIAESDQRIKIIQFQNNYGQHKAIFCGFQNCKGNYIITLDDDLQTPPEEIPKLIQKSEKYSVVYARYKEKKHAMLENIFSSIFQRCIHHVLDIPSNIFVSSFALYRKEVINCVKSINISNIFIPALIRKCVQKNDITNADVDHHPRQYGKSNYSLFKYYSLFCDLFVNYSLIPLLVVFIFGFAISVISFTFRIDIIIEKILNHEYGLIEWNSLIVAILIFIGGMILISLAIMGEYLYRILHEITDEQPYRISEIKL